MRVLKVAGMLCLALAVLRGVYAGPPARMQAAAIDAAGPADALKLHTLPVPAPAADEVLIEVDTAGVALWDADIRAHPDDIKHVHFPLVLGTDGAGHVAALGAAVQGFTVGEAVYAYSWDNPQGGFYAQYVAVPAQRVAHVPAGLSLTEAGAIGTTALTALQGIDDALHVRSGETVIIHGASGGVGTLAVQFAKLRGARVLAIASGDDGLALVKKLGADAAVDGRHGDVAAAARAFAPQGADALLALAGGEALERALGALRAGGRVAYPTGVQPEPKERAGFTLTRYDAIAAPAQFAHLNEAIVAAHLQVPIAAQFALADAAAAHQRLESGHVLGKIVLRVRG
jgi:NADPH:quinone reductase